MDDPDLIATLIPSDNKDLARKAFKLQANELRHLAPTREFAQGPTISSREPSLDPDEPDEADEADKADENSCEYDTTHRIQLRFSNIDKASGFACGTACGTAERRQVVLGHRGVHRRIAGHHFNITFNEQGDLILKGLSTRGTAVSYDGQAKDEVRYRFSWRLDLKKEDGKEDGKERKENGKERKKNGKEDEKWDVEVHVPNKAGLAFKVKLATHETCKDEYKAKVNKFLADRPAAQMDALGLDNSLKSTAPGSETLTPKERPVYIEARNLGYGSFGAVDLVIDVSTGLKQARKRFFEPTWERDLQKRERQREVWWETIRKEVRIMESYPHPKIVPVDDFLETPTPFLLMPYYSFGNLSVQHSVSRITWDETESVVFQSLSGLAYLHPQGVAHRDLKPENILVESRYPLSIKLADFGLANDKRDLTTFCGSQVYAAPEIYFRNRYSNYTTAVDLWSLGVIALQYLCGLPKKPREKQKDWVLSGCRRLIAHASDHMRERPDSLLGLVAAGMLREKAEERLPASTCLALGYNWGLFEDGYTESGTATPTQHPDQQGEIDRDDGSTSILMGALWSTGEASNGNGPSRPEYYSAQHPFDLLEPPANHTTSALGYSGFVGVAPGVEQEGDPEPPAGPFPGLNEIQSAYIPSYKRRRSPAGGSAKNSSSIKRRQAGVGRKVNSVSRSYSVAPQFFEQDRESEQFRNVYDAVLALLADLQIGGRASLVTDDHTCALVKELCEYFAQLEITGMRLSQNGHSDLATIHAVSTSKEFVLASLTSSECMGSTTDLAAHLLVLLQLQSSQTASTPTAPVSHPPLQAGYAAQDNNALNWETAYGDSHCTAATAHQERVTYPSELVDDTGSPVVPYQL